MSRQRRRRGWKTPPIQSVNLCCPNRLTDYIKIKNAFKFRYLCYIEIVEKPCFFNNFILRRDVSPDEGYHTEMFQDFI